ncbi:hypothetical protein [Candidatus Methylomirabilis sp.]|uniref:hypothetical protein n=1 Tax=Candidatus Methylomirabilis sp. TaxID=2032687 RepID=UPI003075FF51
MCESKRAVEAAESVYAGKCRARLSLQKRAAAALADIALLALAALPTADRQAALTRGKDGAGREVDTG